LGTHRQGYGAKIERRREVGKSNGSKPDKVSRDSASFLGTGIGEAHKSTIHKGGSKYSGRGTSRDAADKKAGDSYRKGHKDR
jgi:hypothetical protein